MTLEELTEKKTSAQFIQEEIGLYFSSLDTINADDAKAARALHYVFTRHIAEYDHQIEKIVDKMRRSGE